VAGMSRYATQKNKKNTPKRLELRKYNPYLRRYTLHREVK
jgi:large subunit ribosomal protein L33